MAAPLAGLKVLDFSTRLPGPFATMMLADMGAEVLRVESPTRPDPVRSLGPRDEDGDSAAHDYLNRSKRSLALDLKKPLGSEVARRLAGRHDVLVEQFRPGVMDRLGLAYEALAPINPRLIYCSITGYGQNGPYRERAGHDLNYLALAGIASYCGRRDQGPVPLPVQVADLAGGSLHAVVGILAALAQRTRTGSGQRVDISMTDAALAMNALAGAALLAGGELPATEGTMLNGGWIYDYYRTRDGRYLAVAGLEPEFVRRLGAALEIPDAEQRAYARASEREALKNEIARRIATRDFDDWRAVFAQTDACVEPVLDLAEALDHPQMRARAMVIDVPKPSGASQRQLGCAIKFSAAECRVRRTGPALGEHSIEVLREAGFDPEEIEALVAEGTVPT